jgi:hypothetical protein
VAEVLRGFTTPTFENLTAAWTQVSQRADKALAVSRTLSFLQGPSVVVIVFIVDK